MAVKQCLKLTGTKGAVNTALVGEDALVGSVGMHNHPVWDGFDSGDSYSQDDVVLSVLYKTGVEYLTTGNKRYSFEYTGNLNAEQIHKEYEKARGLARSIAFENNNVLEFEQEETMKILAQILEGFSFDEYL